MMSISREETKKYNGKTGYEKRRRKIDFDCLTSCEHSLSGFLRQTGSVYYFYYPRQVSFTNVARITYPPSFSVVDTTPRTCIKIQYPCLWPYLATFSSQAKRYELSLFLSFPFSLSLSFLSLSPFLSLPFFLSLLSSLSLFESRK